MVISDRRARERAAREQAILDAAAALGAEGGWSTLSMRALAERIEYSVPTIYEHFASKEQLLVGLLRRGFERLGSALAAASEGEADDEKALVKMAMASWRFAIDDASLYQVMHGLDGVPFGAAETPVEARRAFSLLRGRITALAKERRKRLANPDDLADAIWACVHGFIVLNMGARIAGGAERAERLMKRTLGDLLRAWGLS